eukprot:14120751-Heterocapsa_arctica.AAC.1
MTGRPSRPVPAEWCRQGAEWPPRPRTGLPTLARQGAVAQGWGSAHPREPGPPALASSPGS